MATGRFPTTANSPLTAKGDIFTYSTGSAKLAVGNDGESVVADSSTSTGLRYQSAYNGNAIINGGMDIWQRGTSIVSPTTTNFYTADRWGANRAGDVAGLTVSRDTSAPTGFQYSGKFQRVSGNTSTASPTIYYALESADSYRFAGQTVTLSFYAKAGANFTGTTVTPTLYYGTGTDQRLYAFTGITSVATTALAVTTSWVRYSITGTVNAAATEIGFQITWNSVGTAGADDSLYITGAQLELGSVATSFKRSNGSGGSIQGELAACQRYYSRVQAVTTGEFFGMGPTNNTSGGLMYCTFPVRMRIAPTSVDFSLLFLQQYDSGGNYRTANVTSITLSNAGTQSANCNSTTASTSFTTFGDTMQLLSQAGLGYLGFNAEL